MHNTEEANNTFRTTFCYNTPLWLLLKNTHYFKHFSQSIILLNIIKSNPDFRNVKLGNRANENFIDHWE